MGQNQPSLSSYRNLGTIEEVTGRMEATMDNILSSRQNQQIVQAPFESDFKKELASKFLDDGYDV